MVDCNTWVVQHFSLASPQAYYLSEPDATALLERERERGSFNLKFQKQNKQKNKTAFILRLFSGKKKKLQNPI